MLLDDFPAARHVRNRGAARDLPPGAEGRAVMPPEALQAAATSIRAWPGYRPTPLINLPGLAARLGVATLAVKDEGSRFGLGSFKALGGAYAVEHLLRGIDVDAAQCVTVATATDGNHGRSVAWGAQRFGCRCVVYLHERVSLDREAAIAQFGAEIRRVPGGYDASVRRCAADAAANRWHLVADTSADGGAEVAALVMHGYALLATEVLEQAATPFTHVFVQAGVGGLAAAVAAVFGQRLGNSRPRLIVVEPARADCVFRTVAAGRPTPVPGEAHSFMACLAAGEVSPAAWAVLEATADDVLALPDAVAPATMRLLAGGVDGDRPLVMGESGCAAVAGLIAAAHDRDLSAALGIGSDARVLAIGSEGATDPTAYELAVGRPAVDVLAAAEAWREGR